MTDDRSMPASDNRYCMIFRPTLRILPSGCLDCGLSLNACEATRDVERRACCETCSHE